MAESDSEATAVEPRNALRRRAPVAMLATVTAAALVLAGYYYWQHRQVRELEQAREDARRTACAYAPVMADYDAKNLDTYFAAVLAGATGEWKTEFDATSRDLREVLVQGQVVAKVDTVQCAIETADERTARAVAVVRQTITSLGTNSQPRPGQLTVTLSMEKSGDSWLVNNVSSPVLPR
ncbi:hypothetical protein AB0H76_11885 [Nocardia sp. NPDC050712]|uniref:hypothetical protein n=1 Tax=Nocardia sp. NPDC050712 TaxID=3155518 RepID=UPI003410B538